MDLLPCPFCARTQDDFPHGPVCIDRSIKCGNCGACGPQFENANISVEAWNKRPIEHENEFKTLRESFGVKTQDEMSKILGLGTKTYHRWESKKGKPTKSMANLLSILRRHPETFDTLKKSNGT